MSDVARLPSDFRASELQLETLKSENKQIISDNQLLKIERATSVNFILQHASSDSQSLLDQPIKRRKGHWRLQEGSRKFTSAIDLLSFGAAASLLNLLKRSHQVSSHGAQALADVALIQSLFKMKQMDNESPNSYGQRVVTKSKQLSSDYSAIASDKTLAALIYAGSPPRYSEPKAYLLNRERRDAASTFPTTPGDLIHTASTWVSSSANAGKGSVKALAMTQLESCAKGEAYKKEARKASSTSSAGSGNSTTGSPASLSSSVSSNSAGSKGKTVAKKDKETALAALESISTLSQPPTPSQDPTTAKRRRLIVTFAFNEEGRSMK